jgi:hypothetical protein
MAKEPERVRALFTFRGGLDGKDVFVTVGELYWADDPEPKKWPDFFGPIVMRHPRHDEAPVEQATAAPGEKRAR